MKSTTKQLILSLTVLLLGSGTVAMAQTTQTPPPQTATQSAQNPPPAAPGNQMDELGPLNLTADQIKKIRDINLELKDERQAANQRLRKAQRALSEAIESPNPDETLIAQRSREVADAQANTIRLRSLTEARILQVLTPEQRIRVREIRLRNQAAMQAARERQRENGMGQRQPGLQRSVNNQALTPAQRRALKRPPKR
ncbi:MAG TPA: periplasmic heavy metal sensor [Pyrinomonadaceae bacterium]|nr:periplasmic heavy metal sensor [Pyrinomonadaceae bacterium]